MICILPQGLPLKLTSEIVPHTYRIPDNPYNSALILPSLYCIKPPPRFPFSSLDEPQLHPAGGQMRIARIVR